MATLLQWTPRDSWRGENPPILLKSIGLSEIGAAKSAGHNNRFLRLSVGDSHELRAGGADQLAPCVEDLSLTEEERFPRLETFAFGSEAPFRDWAQVGELQVDGRGVALRKDK